MPNVPICEPHLELKMLERSGRGAGVVVMEGFLEIAPELCGGFTGGYGKVGWWGK